MSSSIPLKYTLSVIGQTSKGVNSLRAILISEAEHFFMYSMRESNFRLLSHPISRSRYHVIDADMKGTRDCQVNHDQLISEGQGTTQTLVGKNSKVLPRAMRADDARMRISHQPFSTTATSKPVSVDSRLSLVDSVAFPFSSVQDFDCEIQDGIVHSRKVFLLRKEETH